MAETFTRLNVNVDVMDTADSDSLIITAFSGAGVKWPNKRPEDGVVCRGGGGRVLIERYPW